MRKLGKHIDGILQPKMQAKIQHIGSFLRNSFGLSPAELKDVANGRRKFDITNLEVTMLEGAQDEVKFITQPDNTISALSLLKLLHWIIVELTMPEYLYGTAMSSTNASVKEQSPVWAKKVEGRQGEYNEFYTWLTDVFSMASLAINGRDIYVRGRRHG